MAVRVSIEAGVWSDPRYDVLASLLGVDRYSAVARMASIWSLCTERETDQLRPAFLAVVLGVDPARAGDVLVDAELAEHVAGGFVRIRGCKGRTEWLGDNREAKRRGGKARAAQARRKADGSFAGSQHDPSKAPARAGSEVPPDVPAPTSVRPARAGPAGPPATSTQPAQSSAPAPAPAPAPAKEHTSPKPLARGSEELAEYLRKQIRTTKPDHRLGRTDYWARQRTKWARDAHAVLGTDGRSMHRTKAIVDWVFGDQGGREKRFVVESPKALREKWDSIDTAMELAAGAGVQPGNGAKPRPRANL